MTAAMETGSAALAPDEEGGLRAGEVIADKYKLSRMIGRGAMADVWLASHISLKTEVAIKFVRAEIAQDDGELSYALERFRFEAQISARLGARTRNVVAVHDAGAHAGHAYLVMELVKGRTLEEDMEKDGLLPLDRVVPVVLRVCDALGVAHDLGIVHRDVKPSNIMLVDEGEALSVKVADFGVAKAIRNDLAVDKPRETSEGLAVGSPAFMSPEQIRAEGVIGPAADMWALAVVAYEALTGNLPFMGKSETDLAVAIATAPHDPVTKYRPDLPRTLDKWFTKALAKEPEDRFGTTAEMASELLQALTPKRSLRPFIFAIAGVACVAIIAIAALRHKPPAPVDTPKPRERPVPVETAATSEIAPPPPTTANVTATVPETKDTAPHARGVAPKTTNQAQPSSSASAPPPRPPPKEIDPSEIQ